MSACGVRDAVAEVDLERQQGHGPVARPGPRRDGVGEGEVDQFAGGVFVGEVALGLDRLAQLAVERFYGVCRVDHAADLGWERQERDHVLPGVQPGLGDDREPLAPLLVEALELLLGGVGVQRGVDRLQISGDLLALTPWHVFQ